MGPAAAAPSRRTKTETETAMPVIPRTYQEWEHCITVECGIPLTAEYVAERIAALQDRDDHHTHKFLQTYGEAHHTRTLGWFREAQAKLGT